MYTYSVKLINIVYKIYFFEFQPLRGLKELKIVKI
jgi:hypothetical protein